MPSKWEKIQQQLMGQMKRSDYWIEEPAPKQQLFLMTDHITEVLYGGAAGGGKSSALIMAALQYVDVPGYSALLLRDTYQNLARAGNIMFRFKQWISHFDDVKWNGNDYIATFPSGATVSFGYLKSDGDEENYKSAEYQYIGFDEVTEIREDHYRFMFTRLRKHSSGPLAVVPTRMRAATNPKPNWVRQRFIIEGENKPDRLFIPATLYDNPSLDHADYVKNMENASTIERLRLIHGDWFATSKGEVFDTDKIQTLDAEEFPEFDETTEFVRFWDLAGTEVSDDNRDPDYTVGVKMAFHKGIVYILDIVRERGTPAKIEQLVAMTAANDGVDIPIRMEQEPGQSGKSQINWYARSVLPGYDFLAATTTGSKQTRAAPLVSAMANGNVVMARAHWNSDFVQELSNFPHPTVHDDQVDAAVHGFNFCAGLDINAKPKMRILF